MTTKPSTRPALGRGLSALISSKLAAAAQPITHTPVTPSETKTITVDFGNKSDINQGVAYQYIDITKIIQDATQPRKDFSEVELLELADSIKKLGVIQPILVRRLQADRSSFQIIAGERRWRAAKLAGLLQVPVIVAELSDKEALEVAIVENVQREDLNPLEQAQAYDRLLREFSLSQEEIAARVGKDRASISNLLRMLKLPSEVQEALKIGDLSAGHAKAILAIKEPSAQTSLARKVIKEGLSVRSLEAIVSRMVVLDAGKRSTLSTIPAKQTSNPLVNFDETIERLRRKLGTKVHLKHQRSGKGKIEIEYFSDQELDRLVGVICE